MLGGLKMAYVMVMRPALVRSLLLVVSCRAVCREQDECIVVRYDAMATDSWRKKVKPAGFA